MSHTQFTLPLLSLRSDRSSCKNPLLENTLHFLGGVLLYINSFLFLDALNSPSLIAELSGEVSRVANQLSRKVVC